MGERLETSRVFFLKALKQVGLPVPPHEKKTGVTELVDYLQEHEDCWIKTSKFRGSACGETWHHINFVQSRAKLLQIAYDSHPLDEDIEFLISPNLKTDIECGGDFLLAGGHHQENVCQGYEKKDNLYIATHLLYEKLPDEVKQVHEAIEPLLVEWNYCGSLSSEIRVVDDVPYWIDATPRIPSPPGELLQEWIENLAEVMWSGAQGEVVESKYSHKFACQVALYSEWEATNFQPVEVAEGKERFVKLYAPCCKDGLIYGVPDRILNSPWRTHEHTGWVLGFGNTIEDMIDNVNENLDGVTAFDVTDSRESIAGLLKELQEAEDQGIHFTSQEIPEPSTVLDED